MSDVSIGPWAVTAEFSHEQLVSKMGIELVRCEPGLVIGTMPVDGNRQPVGIMHGGANAVLAETLGSLAAFLYAGPGGRAAGLDLSCTHHRWVASGRVTGVCRPLHEGRTTATYEIVISDGSGRRSCTARLTCAVSLPPAARARGAVRTA
ncbi:hotdog fold thioesterase [Streptomyces sp. WELS2]|uniref:hotdog fold thioesterase n=1 Tax=Streptomyces sp. WELS2 TaxID=2749435 RepID=UPI0015F0B9BA|nr:hotdog fold thioesterase [Streptomyces sp. WELS2]